MTCHNRRDKTIRCINSILTQKGKDYKFDYFICDDGCNDGTSEAILKTIPDAKIIKGNGDLYWARGMALALLEAKKKPCDFLLMINDDVVFYDHMIETMIKTYFDATGNLKAVTGAICDPDTHEYTYGGIIETRKTRKMKAEQILPNIPPNECKLANWNCFLISYNDYHRIGDIDKRYEHSFADFDYSNRICNLGGKILVSEQYVGECKRNTINNTWMDKTLCASERIAKLHKPNGVPIKSAALYWWKYDKPHFIVRLLRPYIAIVKDAIARKA